MEEPKECEERAIPDKPIRPVKVECASIRELYLEFHKIFLEGTKALIVAPCGHQIHCFEHHFFHMAGVVVEGIEELSMPRERDVILGTVEGFAHYELREGGSRARHLRSARETLENPDEIWTKNPRAISAKWIYIKEYGSKPYAFSVALVGEWEANSTIIVPFSSFQCNGKNVRKWRQSERVYP
jgi:hypothetical protein